MNDGQYEDENGDKFIDENEDRVEESNIYFCPLARKLFHESVNQSQLLLLDQSLVGKPIIIRLKRISITCLMDEEANI